MTTSSGNSGDRNDPIVTRKEFFRRCGHGLMEFINELFGEKLDAIAAAFPQRLRPPGALPDGEFERQCSRCGGCVRACPHFAIKQVTDPAAFDSGTPFIKPSDTFCRMCPEFPCIGACPTGALRFTNTSSIHVIGIAHVTERLCVRLRDIPCRACASNCPARFDALSFPATNGAPRVNKERCTGCGACEAACPIRPTPAIIVEPR
ncbi:MAG: 4Fe-4S dicluster domain-containing protein [Candidatus Riflebacteria bacterium]|nr:4Fe-4S dicluster domain-containing protein [Candidatus Riflebacteria bacterium]